MRNRRSVCGALAAGALLVTCSPPDRPPESANASTDGFCESVEPRVDAFVRRMDRERPPPPGDPRYGGTVVFSQGGDFPGGMNVFVGSSHEAFQHQLFVNLMSLIRYDEDLEPRPWLARSWEMADDSTSITFRLRDDVFWHDGVRTSAWDVAFTYERVTDPATGFPNAAFWENYVPGPAGVEVADSFTVTVRLARPHAEPLDAWRALAIMPEHLLRDVPPSELADHPFGTVCPVGNGPFVFVEHRPGESWTFRANPAFPEGLGGRPFVDRYVLRIIPEAATQLAELLTEGTDVYLAPPFEYVEQILEAPHLELRHFLSRSYVFLGWNGRRDRLSDARVRRALTMAIDRRGIVDAILGGYGRVTQTSVPPYHWAYAPDLEDALVYDPAGAARLLDEAGWRDRDGDGIRENAEGDPLRVELEYNQGNPQRTQIAEVIQAQLGSVGVDLALEVVEYGTLTAEITDPERDFDAFLLGWANEFKLDDRDLFHSARIDGAYAFAGTRNPELDRLLDTLQLVVDRDAARPLWHRYQEILVEEQPYTFLFFNDRLVGMNRRLENVRMDVRGDWVNLKDWWIDPGQR